MTKTTLTSREMKDREVPLTIDGLYPKVFKKQPKGSDLAATEEVL